MESQSFVATNIAVVVSDGNIERLTSNGRAGFLVWQLLILNLDGMLHRVVGMNDDVGTLLTLHQSLIIQKIIIYRYRDPNLNNHKKYTVWKFHDFSITKILREINFGNSISATSAISTHLQVLNFDIDEFWQFQKAEIYQIYKHSEPQNGNFRTYSPKLISRKI